LYYAYLCKQELSEAQLKSAQLEAALTTEFAVEVQAQHVRT
jgi:hypothetical protein